MIYITLIPMVMLMVMTPMDVFMSLMVMIVLVIIFAAVAVFRLMIMFMIMIFFMFVVMFVFGVVFMLIHLIFFVFMVMIALFAMFVVMSIVIMLSLMIVIVIMITFMLFILHGRLQNTLSQLSVVARVIMIFMIIIAAAKHSSRVVSLNLDGCVENLIFISKNICSFFYCDVGLRRSHVCTHGQLASGERPQVKIMNLINLFNFQDVLEALNHIYTLWGGFH